MITVKIEINGKVIGQISAVNQGRPNPDPAPSMEDLRQYKLSNGQTLLHERNKGARYLASRMLERIRTEDLIPENNNDKDHRSGAKQFFEKYFRLPWKHNA